MENEKYCKMCHKEVNFDEIGLSKKLINRGTTSFYCISCLSKIFEVDQQALAERIKYYKNMGCTLFQQKPEG